MKGVGIIYQQNSVLEYMVNWIPIWGMKIGQMKKIRY